AEPGGVEKFGFFGKSVYLANVKFPEAVRSAPDEFNTRATRLNLKNRDCLSEQNSTLSNY
ncbi:MAG TPA: hypothetical protein H9975_08250, partial [Candidatus Alistipes avistercoris]|nr:hypothetical protein [Candidatus Alistipes avistercoris]